MGRLDGNTALTNDAADSFEVYMRLMDGCMDTFLANSGDGEDSIIICCWQRECTDRVCLDILLFISDGEKVSRYELPFTIDRDDDDWSEFTLESLQSSGITTDTERLDRGHSAKLLAKDHISMCNNNDIIYGDDFNNAFPLNGWHYY